MPGPVHGEIVTLADVEAPELQLDELPEDPAETDACEEASDEATGEDPDA